MTNETLELYSILVILGIGILCWALLNALEIVRILRRHAYATTWTLLTIIISTAFFGYIFVAFRFLDIQFFPNIDLETIITFVLVIGAIFMLLMLNLNKILFSKIFGVDMSDSKAIEKFAKYLDYPASPIMNLKNKQFSVICDKCSLPISYTIPDLVRSHPSLDRGVVVEKSMGGVNYLLFVRHQCTDQIREIPVRHDSDNSEFEYRSHRSSRPI